MSEHETKANTVISFSDVAYLLCPISKYLPIFAGPAEVIKSRVQNQVANDASSLVWRNSRPDCSRPAQGLQVAKLGDVERSDVF